MVSQAASYLDLGELEDPLMGFQPLGLLVMYLGPGRDNIRGPYPSRDLVPHLLLLSCAFGNLPTSQ